MKRGPGKLLKHLTDLKSRGLKVVRLIFGDKYLGMQNIIAILHIFIEIYFPLLYNLSAPEPQLIFRTNEVINNICISAACTSSHLTAS